MELADLIKKQHEKLIKEESNKNKYKIIKDFRGTYIENQMLKEEKVIDPIFRVFIPAKPERDRKLNIDLTQVFDPYNDSLMDYASIISYKFKKPWKKFNRLIAIHIPLCLNNCWHCYVPKELYVDAINSEDRYDDLTANDIIERFLKQRASDENQGKESNVLRITGGEPFLIPSLINECLEKIKEKGLENEIFLWTETNLEPFMGDEGKSFMDSKENKEILNKLSEYKNFLVHPCFHGLSSEEFRNVTDYKNDEVTLDVQINALKRLIEAGIDVYPTIGSNICNPANLEEFFIKLKSIYSTLPLKVALVKYDCDYEPIQKRLSEKNRNVKIYSKFASLRIWNALLLKTYGIGYGIIPRHLIKEDFPNLIFENAEENIGSDQYFEEILYICKGSFRDLYHQEILTTLSLPFDYIHRTEFRKKWIQEDLLFHMIQSPKNYYNKKGFLFYVDYDEKKLLPIREIEIVGIENGGDILSIYYKLKRYVIFYNENRKNIVDQINQVFREYFGKNTLPPDGKFILLGEDFIANHIVSEESNNDLKLTFASNNNKIKCKLSYETKDFQNIVHYLIDIKKMKKSLFYRIIHEGLKKVEEDNITKFIITAGKSFKIKVEHYLPNYEELDERIIRQRTLNFLSSSEIIYPKGQSKIIFSKYGINGIYFQTKNVKNEEEVTLIFWYDYDEFKAAKIELKIKVIPNIKKNITYKMLASFFLAMTAVLFTNFSKTIDKGEIPWKAFASTFGNIIQSASSLLYLLLIGFFFFLVLWLNEKGFSPKI